MFQKITKKHFVKAASATAVLVSGSAMATEPAAVDVSGLTSTITGSLTPIGAVGLAVLGVLAAIMVYKLIRRVM